MLRKLLHFLKYIFIYESEDEDFNRYKHVPANRTIKVQDTKIVPKKINQSNIKSKPKKNVINKDNLIYRIKQNLFFINNLMGKMETLEEYLSYYEKLRELQEQSKNCLKILLRINVKAPYYQSTALVVLKHTNTVAELLDV